MLGAVRHSRAQRRPCAGRIMTGKYTKEIMFEIWNDKHGTCVEVGPDRDSLGLIEVRYKDINGQTTTRFTFEKDEARFVAEALLGCVNQSPPTDA